MSSPKITKVQAVREFRAVVLPSLPRGDKPAMREAWNGWTDFLCKDGVITTRQYETWVMPVLS